MRDTFLIMLTYDEKNILHQLTVEDTEAEYRAKIILLKYDGYTIPEIRRTTNHHDSNIRKWIHRFNEKDIDGIISKIHKHKSIKITDDIEKKIIEIAAKNPKNGL
jgi:transposase